MGFFKDLVKAVTNPVNWLSAAVFYATGGTIGTLGRLASAASVFALTATMQALTPTPKIPSVDNSRRVTGRSPNESRKLLYGETRIGGNMVYLESTEDNKYLHMVIVFAPHEITSFDQIYFNDDLILINPSGQVVNEEYADTVVIEKVTKGSVAATPALLAANLNWTPDHILQDQAYLYVRLEYNAEAFPTGIPNITATMKGRKVYDPRSDTTAYSNNPALVILDYLTDDVFGLGAKATEVDYSSFITAANVCDEQVQQSTFFYENRYTCDGVIDTKNTPKGNIESLLTSLNGNLYYSNGLWHLRAGAYVTPTETLDEDDFVSSIVVQTAVSRNESHNAVKGQFFGPAAKYMAADYPAITSSVFEDEDNGERRFMNVDLPFTSSSSMAQRIAKQMLYRNRQEISLKASFKLTAFKFEIGDTVMVNNSRLGFVNKVFEVTSWQLNFTADRVTVDCTLSETSPDVYDWDAEEQEFAQDNTVLPSAKTPPVPANFTLTATAVINDDGITIPAIRADWDVADGGFVQYYEIQYKRLGGEEDYGSITVSHTETENWGSIASPDDSSEDFGLINEDFLAPDAQYQSVLGTTNSYTIIPVLNGYDYNVRVRSINSFGVRSAFTSATLASEGDTTPPGTPSSLFASALYKAIEIRWTNPTDQDLDYVEVWENTTDNLSTASLIGTSGSSNFLRANLNNNITRFYWVRAVDLSLNKSPFTTSVNATTLLIEPNDFNDAVNDLFQEAGAFGIEPVSSLPTSGDFDGQIVLLKTDLTLYRWDTATLAWDSELYTASSLTAGSITLANFASGIEPIGIVNTLPTVSGYTGAQVVFLTTDNKLYRYTGTAWTAATSTQDLTGELGEGLFSDDLRPIERVTSLPVTALTQGRVVMLTTDNKLYRYDGNAWTSDVAASDIEGQLNGSQIGDGVITSTKISDDAVTAPKVAANAIVADNIVSNAITSAKITSGAISSDKIATNAVTAGKVAADAITAGTIAAGAINASSLFVDGVIQSDAIATGAIVTNKLAASSVIASKIGVGAVTADKISVSELSAISANLGTIEVGSANIADGAITTAKIGSAQIATANIQTAAINTLKIAQASVSNAATQSFSLFSVDPALPSPLEFLNISVDLPSAVGTEVASILYTVDAQIRLATDTGGSEVNVEYQYRLNGVGAYTKFSTSSYSFGESISYFQIPSAASTLITRDASHTFVQVRAVFVDVPNTTPDWDYAVIGAGSHTLLAFVR